MLYNIRDYISFFNCHVIEHIVDGLCTDQDRVEFPNYEKEFDEYSKHRVYECPPEGVINLTCGDNQFAAKVCSHCAVTCHCMFKL